jgi:hypothetical protein
MFYSSKKEVDFLTRLNLLEGDRYSKPTTQYRIDTNKILAIYDCCQYLQESDDSAKLLEHLLPLPYISDSKKSKHEPHDLSIRGGLQQKHPYFKVDCKKLTAYSL